MEIAKLIIQVMSIGINLYKIGKELHAFVMIHIDKRKNNSNHE